MPVGKVFNAAENQVLFSPVSAIAQGKAIRAGQKKADLENEALQLGIDSAPAVAAAAAAKAQREADENERKQIKADQDTETHKRKIGAEDFIAKSETYKSILESDGEEMANKYIMNDLAPKFEAMSPDAEGYADLARIMEDGKITPQEVEQATIKARTILDPKYGTGESGARTAQKFVDRDGNPVQGSMGKDGVYRDSSGRVRTDITPFATNEGGVIGFGGGAGDAASDRKTREVLTSTDNLLSSVDRIDSQIEKMDQAALGLPGKLTSVVDNTVSAVVGFAEIGNGVAQINGEDVSERSLLDVRLYRDVFSGPAADNAALQANSVGLAYSLARAANPDGRISDADVRHQLERVKLDKSSKTQIQAALKEVRRSILVDTTNQLRVGGYVTTTEGKAAYDKYMEEIEAMDADGSEGIVINSSDEAGYDALPVGTEFTDENGKKWVKE